MRLWIELTLLLGLCACAPPPQPDAIPLQPPPEMNRGDYLQAAAQGLPVYRVSTEDSLVTIQVDPAGTLSRLGHSHIVAVRKLEGWVIGPGQKFAIPETVAGEPVVQRQRDDWPQGDFRVHLPDLTLDETGLRTRAGFDRHPKAEDIEATRRNMLEKVLQADRFPWVSGSAVLLSDEFPEVVLGLTLKIAQHTWQGKLPAQLYWEQEQMIIEGELKLNQGDLGLTPFAALGGSLKTADLLMLKYRVLAQPLEDN